MKIMPRCAFILAVVVVILVPGRSFAITAAELNAEIQRLLQVVANLQTQVATLTATSTAAQATSTAQAAPSTSSGPFTRDLAYNLRNDQDVAELQEFLTAQGFFAYSATGNYLALTREAVRNFQRVNGLPITGAWDAATRVVANNLFTRAPVTSVVPPSQSVRPFEFDFLPNTTSVASGGSVRFTIETQDIDRVEVSASCGAGITASVLLTDICRSSAVVSTLSPVSPLTVSFSNSASQSATAFVTARAYQGTTLVEGLGALITVGAGAAGAPVTITPPSAAPAITDLQIAGQNAPYTITPGSVVILQAYGRNLGSGFDGRATITIGSSAITPSSVAASGGALAVQIWNSGYIQIMLSSDLTRRYAPGSVTWPIIVTTNEGAVSPSSYNFNFTIAGGAAAGVNVLTSPQNVTVTGGACTAGQRSTPITVSWTNPPGLTGLGANSSGVNLVRIEVATPTGTSLTQGVAATFGYSAIPTSWEFNAGYTQPLVFRVYYQTYGGQVSGQTASSVVPACGAASGAAAAATTATSSITLSSTISPSSGTLRANESASLTLTGSGFTNNSVVEYLSIPALEWTALPTTYVSATTLRASVNATRGFAVQGIYSLRARNSANNERSNTISYSVLSSSASGSGSQTPPPSTTPLITSVSIAGQNAPYTITRGSTVILQAYGQNFGSGFDGSAVVEIGTSRITPASVAASGGALSVQIWNNSYVQVMLNPSLTQTYTPGSVTWPIRVTTNNGATSATAYNFNFTVVGGSSAAPAASLAASFSAPQAVTVAPGASVTVAWTVTAGTPASSDWIGLYRVGDGNNSYQSYQYVNAARSLAFTMPVGAGTYEFRYLLPQPSASGFYPDIARSGVITVSPANTTTYSDAGTSASGATDSQITGLPTPTISDISVLPGLTANQRLDVFVNGANFTNDSYVEYSGAYSGTIAASFLSHNGSYQMSWQTGSAGLPAGTYNVVVRTPGASAASNTRSFTLAAATAAPPPSTTPLITSVSIAGQNAPYTITRGSTVILQTYGQNFGSAFDASAVIEVGTSRLTPASVAASGGAVSVQIWNDSYIQAILAPSLTQSYTPGSVTWPIRVTTNQGAAGSGTYNFTFTVQ